MNRQEFRAAYRAARLAEHFYSDMKSRLGVEVPSMFVTFRACPGYCPTRLSRDRLFSTFPLVGDPAYARLVHNNRMCDLRCRVKLPA